MFGKPYAPGLLGLLLLICIGFSVGFFITYGLIQQNQIPYGAASLAPLGNDKAMDGLNGPVNRVRTETARLSLKDGKLAEEPRELLGLALYDSQGKKIDGSYYLVSGNRQAGREEYAHDEKGNISEMTSRDANNNILSREIYTYEHDAIGNWVKMVTSRVVYEGGKLTRQPIEVTYRNITYYFDQAIAEIVNSNPAASEGPRGAGDLATLRTALNDWVAATNARDLEKLLKFYNSKIEVFYRARNVTPEFVREDKADSFERAEVLEVSAGKPEITVNSDEQSATMRFRKEYFIKVNGRERRGRVLQVLEWKLTDEGWKIVGERDQRILR
jgi:hypothetical protein